ncbi:MAG: acyltransferase [Bacteroidales bacterium]|nr:acyltransferase [Bacteroidales bacterium]
MKEKNLSIELLKFMAVIIVMNGHMDVLYGKWDFLATGGAIGDALFFFVSGYTIFLGSFGRFDNWYKRRIKRVYPSVIAWAAVLSFWNFKQLTVVQLVNGGGYWFISCIMLYYVVLWVVRRFAEHKPLIPIFVCCFGVVIWYYMDSSCTDAMYGNNYFKWMFFFLFMLIGAYIGNSTLKIKFRFWSDVVSMSLSLVLFYGIQIVGDRYSLMSVFQLLTLMPLIGVALFGYKLCCSEVAVRMMHTKLGWCIRLISGLCLEVYIVQVTLIPLLANTIASLFPFSFLITFVAIIFVAYLTRCIGRVFSQLFDKEDMDWGKVFKAVS